ncbi:hypothetical protein [Halioxenophilus aromaticivorans]|uniref:Uncharacterized protein n=1 Tax=Halioxenophilus aromaticivorans TaxID=1306992 RepID=A0AAV3TX60_9ALTE
MDKKKFVRLTGLGTIAATAMFGFWAYQSEERIAHEPSKQVEKVAKDVLSGNYKNDFKSNQVDQKIEILQAEILHLREEMALARKENKVVIEEIRGEDGLSQIEAEQLEAGHQADEESDFAIEEKMHHRQSLYQAQLLSEAVDVEWSDETLAQIEESLLTESLEGLDFMEGECGTTLCQIKMRANENLPVEESLQRLSVDRPWDGPTFMAVDSTGNVDLFFARDGHDLPEGELM